MYDEQEPCEAERYDFTDSDGTLHMQSVLISYNKKYEPKLVSPLVRFSIVGRVLNLSLTPSEEVIDLNTINRVQTLADERGLTLCQLSKICSLSEATIRLAPKRGNQLSLDTIERICEALDISLSEFFAETVPK